MSGQVFFFLVTPIDTGENIEKHDHLPNDELLFNMMLLY